MSPFVVTYEPDALDDLRRRLRATRWPERETVDDWSQGAPLAYAQDLIGYWADEFDLIASEARANRHPQFRTTIDGLGIHFLHVRSPHADALPLLLTHGWPGSVVELRELVGPLTDPTAHGGDASDAFHVVIPSLPGFGWSDKPSSTGWGLVRTAAAWAELMARLGYDRYGTQGGDLGAFVSCEVGAAAPEHVAGIHVQLAVVRPDLTQELTPREQAALAAQEHHVQSGSGYAKIQSTRPQTLGYGLADSPAGQALWIAEKFWAWTDNQGSPDDAVPRDQLLDNVMAYWMTNSATSAARMYWEEGGRYPVGPVTLPSGVSNFPKEIARPSRRWVEERFTDLRWWGEPARGGHFAAMEAPELLVDELRGFFRTVR